MNNYVFNRNCRCLRCMSHTLMGAAMIITVGVVALLDNFRVIYWHDSWPLFLIVVGALMIARNNASTAGHIQPGTPSQAAQIQPYPGSSSLPPPQNNSSTEVNRG
jgi:LiaI-LiaF-like transmembrane region